MKKQILNPFVFTKKTSYMQRIADYVRNGHTRYVCGQIPIQKAGFFAAKMDFLYACYASKWDALRMRKKGHSSTRLLFYHEDKQLYLHWVLLATPGDWFVPDAGRETWLDPTEQRITLTGYELVRHIRAGNAKPSWTWRYTAAKYKELREAIVLSIRRHHNEQLRQMIESIWRSPAYAGVREQIKKLAQLMKSEWTRSGVGDMPKLPKGLGYVRRVPDKGKRLTDLLKGLEYAPGKERGNAGIEHEDSPEAA